MQRVACKKDEHRGTNKGEEVLMNYSGFNLTM